MHAKWPTCWVLGSLRIEPYRACLESRVRGESQAHTLDATGHAFMTENVKSWSQASSPWSCWGPVAGPLPTMFLPRSLSCCPNCERHGSQIWMAWCLGGSFSLGDIFSRTHYHQNSCPPPPPSPLGVRPIGGLKGTCRPCFLPDLQQGLPRRSL